MNAIVGRQLCLLFAAAFAARLLLFLLFRPWTDAVVADSVIVDDAAQYHRLAVCIVQELSFCGDTFRTPGYPAFIALFYALFGETPWIVLLSQAFVDLATMYVIFKIGQLVFTERVGLIAAGLFAFDTNAMFATTTLLTETLFVCALMAGFYCYLRALLRSELASAILGGLLLALATLIRPVAEYFFVILIVFALAWLTTGTVKSRLKVAAILSLAFAVTIAPWAYRNYTLYDTPGLSSIQGENLLFWQVTYAKTWETGRAPEDIEAEFRAEAASRGYVDGGNPFENAAIAQEIAVEYITSHPVVYASRLMTGILHTFTNLGTGGIVKTLGFAPTYLPPEVMFSAENELQLVSRFFATKTTLEIAVGMLVLTMLLAHYSAFALGAVTLLAERRFAILLLFCGAIAYFAITSGPIGLARFRLPMTPLYLLVGGVFIDHLLEWTRARRAAQLRAHA